MKGIIICLLYFVASVSATAQTGNAEVVNKAVFLLPEFTNGKVLFKNGTNQQAMLNYNTLYEQMNFLQNGSVMALDQINTIDTVYLDSLKFVPVDSIFYEVTLEQTKLPLYIRHSCIVTKEGTATPFGGTTQTGAVQNLSSYRLGLATPYQLKPADNYTVDKSAANFIKINNQLTLVKSLTQLEQLYPGNEKKIIRFIEDNDIVFNKRQDLEKLLLFIGTFNRKN